MGFLSDLFDSPSKILRTDGLYICNFQGHTKAGYCPGMYGLFLFDGTNIYFGDGESLFYPTELEVSSFIEQSKVLNFNNLKSSEVLKDSNKIEIKISNDIYRGYIYKNKLVMDYYVSSIDFSLIKIVEDFRLANLKFTFYKKY